jgi:type IV pilus assembly protein PilE
MQRGVTLIELMMVITVLGILAAIAVPGYRQYLLRANRTDAKSALMQLQAAEEKFYLQNNAYTDKIIDAPPAGLGMSDTTVHGFYVLDVDLLTVNGIDAQGFSATATPIAGKGQADDAKCNVFTINDAGKKKASGPLGDIACWQ